MAVRVYPYRQGSAGAKALADALGAKVLRREGSRYRPRAGDWIVNWGATDLPLSLVALSPLNHPEPVKNARDKLRTFFLLSEAGVPTVEWTTDPLNAETWLSCGHDVFVRHSTTGQGGSGIEVIVGGEPPAPLPYAPLYTKLFRARHEYRVHVVGDATLAVKKRRREGAERNVVRNHANGYVYCMNNVTAPASVLDAARNARAALDLRFAAVDILCTDSGEARVLEVNTAPGLEGRTIEFYATSIGTIIGRN